MNRRHRLCTAVVAPLVLAASARADLFGFSRITNNADHNVASQFLVEITDAGAGFADFRFTNAALISSSITDVYFDDGTLLGIASISSSRGVAFSQPATPGDLPGGNTLDPPFETSQRFAQRLSADSDPPVFPNGVNTSSEWLNIRFALFQGATFSDVIAAMLDGSLRIGLHVQGIGPEGESDSFVNDGHGKIPAPGALVLGALGLTLVGRVRRTLN